MNEGRIDFRALVKRVDADKMGDFISYDEEKCEWCGLCAVICPFELWTVREVKARLAPRYQELRLERSSCWEICEREAIDFSYHRGGTGVVIECG